MAPMTPSPGRIVEYTLSEQDADNVNRRRKDAHGNVAAGTVGHTGFVLHVGNAVKAGDTYPMVIVRCWGQTAESCVNGSVLLDGSDTLWVTSVNQGDGERHWRAFSRV